MSTHYRGLCSTCNHAAVCSHGGTPGRPVFYCEEFDAYVAVRTSPAVERTPSPTAANARDIGLCVNCDNRSACTHPKPEGGVWHCEEYR